MQLPQHSVSNACPILAISHALTLLIMIDSSSFPFSTAVCRLEFVVCSAMPDEAKALIEANIRRNLGVFSVPRYLHDGDPYDKTTGLRSRNGFQTHRNTEWWRENVRKERMGLARRASSATSAASSHNKSAANLPKQDDLKTQPPHKVQQSRTGAACAQSLNGYGISHALPGSEPWLSTITHPSKHPQKPVFFYLPCFAIPRDQHSFTGLHRCPTF